MMPQIPNYQPQMQPQHIPMDQQDYDEGNEFDAEKYQDIEKKMSDDQRKRFQLLRGDATRIPKKQIKDMMKAVAPEKAEVPDNVADTTSKIVKLFVAELVETAKTFHTSKGILEPEDIMLAFHKLEDDGKIPGRSLGKKRAYLK